MESEENPIDKLDPLGLNKLEIDSELEEMEEGGEDYAEPIDKDRMYYFCDRCGSARMELLFHEVKSNRTLIRCLNCGWCVYETKNLPKLKKKRNHKKNQPTYLG